MGARIYTVPSRGVTLEIYPGLDMIPDFGCIRTSLLQGGYLNEIMDTVVIITPLGIALIGQKLKLLF